MCNTLELELHEHKSVNRRAHDLLLDLWDGDAAQYLYAALGWR